MIRDFPHTVCVEEMKTIVTVQEAERMDKKRKRTKGTLPDDGIRRYLYFAAIPVVVLILVVVILHSDKKKDAGQPEAVAMTAETGQPEGLNEGDPAVDESSAADSSKYTLKQDEMPELTALVQSYCQAKTDCDPEALQQLFGVTDLSEDQIAAEREKMELVKASIKAYKNVKKQEDGQYRMVSELSDTEKEYVKAVSERADVKELQDQVKEAAAVAVSEDEVLQQVYTHNGSSEVSIGTQEQ